MASEKSQENDSTVIVADATANTPTTLFAPVKSAAEELPPLSVGASRGSALQEPTIRQVAPLVLILTGASFLNASPNFSKCVLKANIEFRQLEYNLWSSSYPALLEIFIFPRQDKNGSCRRLLLRRLPFFFFVENFLMCMERDCCLFSDAFGL